MVVKTKGGTTCTAYCGPPFGPSQNFHSSKSCSKPSDSKRNCFLSWKQIFFSSEKHVFQVLKWWSKPKGGPDALHTVVSPLVHFKIFTHQNVGCRLLKPSESNRNYFLSWKQAFFQLKNKFLNFWIFFKTKWGTTCILWCPLWSMSKFSLAKMLVVDCWNHPILIETISFRWKQAFFQLKNKFLNFSIFRQIQRGDHMHTVMPALVHVKIFTHQNVGCRLLKPSDSNRNYFLSWKQAFLQLKNKFLNFCQNQRGDHMTYYWCSLWSMSKFSLTKMLVVDCWNHPILIETISSRENKYFFNLKTSISIFEFFRQNQRGDHMTCILWCPLWSMSKFSRTQNVGCRLLKPSDSNRNYFLSWKQAFFQLKNKFLNFWIFHEIPKGWPHCILWSPLWSMSKFSLIEMLVVDGRIRPILIETISFHRKKNFFNLKTSFWIFEYLGKTKGGTTWHACCGAPLGPCQNFCLTQNVGCRLLKPSISNRNYFLSWKQAFFQLKNKFLNFWIFCQNQRGDHMTYCGAPFGPCQNFHSPKCWLSIVETIRI